MTPSDDAAAREAAWQAERAKRVTQTELAKVHRLTPAMIAALGPPDETVTNRHHRRGPPIKIWSLTRVQHFVDDNADWFAQLAERRAKLSATSSATAERKRQETMEYARTVHIEVQVPSRKQLEASAVEHYSERRSSDCEVGPGGVLAHARHAHTNYEWILSTLEGRHAHEAAYRVVRDRVDALVLEALKRKRKKGKTKGNQPSTAVPA